MKTKLTLILMLLSLTGCQPKSEIDKCVDDLIKNRCIDVSETPTKEEKKLGQWSRAECVDDTKQRNSAMYRLRCLKAQAGKE